ncbi:MAG: hypothetical protein ACLP0A_18300 [Verrucomicrobiia bacterium]
MPNKLTLGELRRTTGIPLVSAEVEKPGAGRSYKKLEKECESKTHREMREYGIRYFRRLGYRVFPEAVGVVGVFTFADFLAERPGRVVFVECLTDKNLTKEVLARKLGLQRFGEICFIVVGGHGCQWAFDDHEIPRVANQLSHRTDVLQFYYGHWQNDRKKRVEHLTCFPRICFDLLDSGRPRVVAEFDLKRVTCDTTFQFTTTPYVAADLATFAVELAFHIARIVKDKGRLKTSPRWGFGVGLPKMFKDEFNRVVVSVRIVDQRVKITAVGRDGAGALVRIFRQLPSLGLDVEYDKTLYKGIIANLRTRSRNFRAQQIEVIESSLYETDVIVLALVHFFKNTPSRVADLRKHLPGRISSTVAYWLKRGLQLGVLRQTDEGTRALDDRTFVATEKGLHRTSGVRVKSLVHTCRVLVFDKRKRGAR